MRIKIKSTGQEIVAQRDFAEARFLNDWEEVVEVAIPPSRREAILARLAEIDATTDKPRTRRELALAKAATKAWLQTLDDEASALRTELAGL